MPVFINDQTNIVSSCGLSRRLRIAFGQCLHLPHTSPGDSLFFLAPQPSVSKHPLAPILQGAASVLPSSLELRRRVAPCNVFDIIKGQSCNRARHVNCSLMGHVRMWQFLIIRAVPRQDCSLNELQMRSTHEGPLTQ